MHPGFMYSQVDAHHARNPWLNEVGAQYHAVYGKLTENPLITPATLAQNYQLQLQLTSTGNVNDMPDDWPRTPIYCRNELYEQVLYSNFARYYEDDDYNRTDVIAVKVFLWRF